MEIRGGGKLVDNGRRNVKIELEFWKAEFAKKYLQCVSAIKKQILKKKKQIWKNKFEKQIMVTP